MVKSSTGPFTLPFQGYQGDPTILTIHGIPAQDPASKKFTDPALQFEPIRQALQLPQTSWQDFYWSSREPTFRDFRTAVRHLEQGNFCLRDVAARQRSDYVVKFEEWMGEQLESIPTTIPIIMLAYSAGALLLYYWLANSAVPKDIDRIAMIFCLAGPYRFEPAQKMFFEEIPHHVFEINEPSVDHDALARKLRPWQLAVLLGQEDVTVLNLNGSFLTEHIQSSLTLQNLVDQHVIVGASHSSIRRHSAVLDYIRARVQPW